jgi:hypothetical protein
MRCAMAESKWRLTISSPGTLGNDCAGQGRAELHCRPGTHTQEHGREHQQPRKVVEHLPNLRAARPGGIPDLVVEEILRGMLFSMAAVQHTYINSHDRSSAWYRMHLRSVSSSYTLVFVLAATYLDVRCLDVTSTCLLAFLLARSDW